MTNPAPSPTTHPHPPLPLAKLASILSTPLRWQVLSVLAAGEGMMVSHLADRFGCTPNAMGKQLAMLRDAGVVRVGPGNLYHLADPFRPAPGQRAIHFGFCVLFADAVAGQRH